MTLARGPQVFLDGDAALAARGGAGRTMRENVNAMELLFAAGIVGDGTSVDGKSRTGVDPEDVLLGLGEALTALNGLSKTMLSSQSVAGPVVFASAGTALDVTNTAHLRGTVGLGSGFANYIQVTGAAASPVLQVTGSGTNGTLFLRSQGVGRVTIGSPTSGNITSFIAAASNTDGLQITQPSAAGNQFRFDTTNGNGGFNFVGRFTSNRTWTYSGLATAILNQPFSVNQTISGTSGNTDNYDITNFAQTFTAFKSTQRALGFHIQSNIGAGSVMRPHQPFYVTANQTGQPATISDIAWQANTAYSVPGTPVTNGIGLYELKTAGTSAASGGPTGGGASITDGTCVWSYVVASGSVQLQVGAEVETAMRYNVGGTSTAPAGNQWAIEIGATLNSGATNYFLNSGIEVGTTINNGSNATRQQGIVVINGGAQGDEQDFGIVITRGAVQADLASGFSYRNPLLFEYTDDNSVLISVGSQRIGTNVPNVAGVLDAIRVTTTGLNNFTTGMGNGGGGFILRGPDFALLGPGNGWNLQHAGLKSASGVLTIDQTFSKLTAVGATSGGTLWTTGDACHDAYGNFGEVTASAGVPTGVTLTGPFNYIPTASVPGGAVTWYPVSSGAFVGTSGHLRRPTNFTVASETYAAGTTISVGTSGATTINIGKSGGNLGFFGATAAAKPTGVAVTAAGVHAALVTLGLIAA